MEEECGGEARESWRERRGRQKSDWGIARGRVRESEKGEEMRYGLGNEMRIECGIVTDRW